MFFFSPNCFKFLFLFNRPNCFQIVVRALNETQTFFVCAETSDEARVRLHILIHLFISCHSPMPFLAPLIPPFYPPLPPNFSDMKNHVSLRKKQIEKQILFLFCESFVNRLLNWPFAICIGLRKKEKYPLSIP